MIKLPDSEEVRLEFTSGFDAERNKLVDVRAKNFSQNEMADYLRVSIRTIQHFEKGRNYNGYILTGYRVMAEILDNK